MTPGESAQSPGAPAATSVAYTAAAYGIRILLGAVTGVIISRVLHPDGRAAYYVIVVIASTATILGHLSLGQASMAHWASSRLAIPTNNLIAGPVLGGTAAALTWLFIAVVGPDLGAVPDPLLLLVALASVPIAVTNVQLDMVVLLLGRTDVYNLSVVLGAFVQCGALIGAAVVGHATVGAVVWIWAASSIVSPLVSVLAIRRHFGRGDIRLAWWMLRLAIKYHVGCVALFLLLRVDILILNALVPATAVGLYSLAVSIGYMTDIGTDALAKAALHRQAAHEMDRAGEITVASTRTSVILAAATVGGLCVVAPVVVPLLYGADFAGTVPALYALAPGVFALAATRSIGAYLVRLARPWLMSGLTMLALTLNVALNLLLIPRYGVIGCAAAASAGYIALAGSQVAWFARATRRPAATLLPRGRDIRAMWARCGHALAHLAHR